MASTENEAQPDAAGVFSLRSKPRASSLAKDCQMMNWMKIRLLGALYVVATVAGCCAYPPTATRNRAEMPPASPAVASIGSNTQVVSQTSAAKAGEPQYPWFERENSILRATQYLLAIRYTNTILKAKQVSAWVDEDEERGQPVVIVVYHWTYPKGPKGPQDFMVVLNRAEGRSGVTSQ